MNIAILTIGPQGSGKSQFCKKAITKIPVLVYISRDEILIELFGSTYLSPYTDGHLVAYEKMWEKVQKVFRNDNNITMILDCWNGFAGERRKITRKLRNLGVGVVGGWQFMTPKEECVGWFVAKRKEDRLRRDGSYEEWMEKSDRISAVHNYELFHEQPVDFNQGFDFIHRINPLEPEMLFEKLLVG